MEAMILILIGAVAGASIGSFLAYMSEKAIVKDNSQFGKGDPRGIAAPESGNNAAAGGKKKGENGGKKERKEGKESPLKNSQIFRTTNVRYA